MGRDKVKEAVVGVRTKYCPSSRAGPAFLGITRFNHIGVLPSADHDCSSVSINAQKYSKRRITASLFAHTKQHTPCASYAVGVLYRPTIGYIQLNYRQARREPQRGLGKHYRGALSQTHSVCLEIETPKASRGRKGGERCPLTIRLGVRGSVASSPSGIWGGAPAENGFYAYFRSERSHLEHHFQYF